MSTPKDQLARAFLPDKDKKILEIVHKFYADWNVLVEKTGDPTGLITTGLTIHLIADLMELKWQP